MREILNKISPNSNIIEVPDNMKKGPVYAVSKVFNHIDDNEEVIFSYCDYGTVWDFESFLKEKENYDGLIPSYIGFHPHMLGSDNYAFSKMNGKYVEEIREKQNLVYSISVQDYGITKIPDEKYTLVINFDCDPKNKDKIFTEIDKVLDKLKKGDFPQHYLDDAIKAQVTNYLINRESNRWLVGAISGYYEDKEPLQMINAIDVIVKSIHKNDIKKFANETFKDKFVQASLMPKK
jgi:hypothetical protein